MIRNPDCQKPSLIIKTSEISAMLQKFYPFLVKQAPTARERQHHAASLLGFLEGMIGHAQAIKWCEDNLGPNSLVQIGKEHKFDPYGDWSYWSGNFHFPNATTATAFKLVWG